MAPDRHFLTIVEAAELIAERRLSPVELIETYLARIAEVDDQLASFVTVTAERARRDARKAEAEGWRRARGVRCTASHTV